MIKAAKYYSLIMIVFLSGSVLLGQGIMEPVTAFETLMSQRYAHNPLHHRNNPAFLLFDTSEELLTLQTTVDNSNGTFR
ncbi:hypothetical protein KAH55_00935, partial [bacterium]|nr:hypothetical protein [bacterium]